MGGGEEEVSHYAGRGENLREKGGGGRERKRESRKH